MDEKRNTMTNCKHLPTNKNLYFTFNVFTRVPIFIMYV